MTAEAIELPQPVPKVSRKYERIGWAVVGHASVRFELPIDIPGRTVYLLEKIGERSPLKDVLENGDADLYDGTGKACGRIHGSVKGRLLVLDIDGAPALACVVRQQLVKHVERKEATPVLAFPNEAAVWGAPA